MFLGVVGGRGEEAGVEIEEMGLLLGPGEGGIKPAQPLQIDHLFGEVALVDDDRGPLAALALVGGDGVGEFDLQGLGTRVLLGGLGDLAFAAEVSVVEHHILEECLHAGAGQARSFDMERVEQDGRLEGRGVREVLHDQVGCGVAQAIALEPTDNLLDDERVAVGDEVGGVGVVLLEPMVIVADDHQPVAGVEFLLAPEDAAADLFVEVVGPAVGAGDDDDILFAVSVVQVVEELGEVVAGDNVEVRVGRGGELGEGGVDRVGEVLGEGNVLPQGMGVGEDPAVEFLADDVVEVAFGEGQVEFTGEARSVEGGRDGAADGRELGVVADEDDAAARGLQAELEEVGEEVAVMEAGARGTGLAKAAVASDHGGFVDDEDCALAGVGGDGGRRAAVGGGLSEVDAPVDGARLEAGIAAHDLGGAAGGGEEFDRAAEVAQDLHEGGHRGGLSRSGIAADHQAAARLRADEEAAQRVQQRLLTRRGGVREGGAQALFDFFRVVAGHGGMRDVGKVLPGVGKVRACRVAVRQGAWASKRKPRRRAGAFQVGSKIRIT